MGSSSPRSSYDYQFMDGEAGAVDYSSSSASLSLVFTELPTETWRYRGLKRGIDIGMSLIMIGVCLVPGMVIAAAIALTSKGPVFYRETRIGRNGRPFRIWKFRSMQRRSVKRGQGDSPSQFEVLSRWRTHKDCHDPRITKVGNFLRKWSLDELPQLLNVLSGEMSLVGPRPVIKAELPLYTHLVSYYLAATPGLSGLWQVSGRSNVNFSTRARLDARYVESWTLRKDLVILVRTIPAVLRRVGAR